jgi:hypothetical protein
VTFAQRLINVTITLGNGTTFADGSTTLKLTGLRVSALIEKYGAPSFNIAVLRIYGMTLDHMNAISTHWVPYPKFSNNTVLVEAGDAVNGMSVAFTGGIRIAWANLQPSPEGFFEITAYSAYESALATANSVSFDGAVNAETILAGLAQQMGMSFEGNGFHAILAKTYFWGSARQQAQDVADAVGAQLYYDDTSTPTTMVVLSQDGHRSTPVPLISKDTGLAGYPTYTGSGIEFKCEYNPKIQFLGQVQIVSIITAANGLWTVQKLTHDLESRMPDGKWFTEVRGYVVGTQ